MVRQILPLCLLAACAGAGGARFDRYEDADLGDAEVVSQLSAEGAAPLLVQLALLETERFDSMAGNTQFGHASCPKVIRTDLGYIIDADCQHWDGIWLSGTLTVERRPDFEGLPQVFMEARDFGSDTSYECLGQLATESIRHDGTIRTWGHRFHVDMNKEATTDVTGCGFLGNWSWSALYDGQIRVGVREGGTRLETWSGQGRLGSTALGVVDLKSEGAVYTGCPNGPIAGRTTLSAGGRTLDIEHDACGGLEWLEP